MEMQKEYSEMKLGQVMDLYPQTWGLFRQMGVCCVFDGNVNHTVAELCAENGMDLDRFLEVFQQLI